MGRFSIPACAALLTCLLASAPAVGQSVSLNEEQRQMLNQLPPAERQQAMQALMGGNASAADPGATLNEQIDNSSAGATLMAPEPLRARPGSLLVIDFQPRASLTDIEMESLQDDLVLRGLTGSNTYVLTDSAVLRLPGAHSIPLRGLTEDDIERRLGADPLLSVFDVDVRILDYEPIGADALQPFGYDIFDSQAGGLDAPSSGPVPPDYVLGPGDSVRVQLFGNVNGIYEFEVTRDGILNLPEIGPVTVAGLPFSEFRQDVSERVNEMLIGTQVSVTMGQLRTMRVFVLGDVNRPGSFVVDSLSTISSVLYRAGGVSPIGSLRNIQLKRNGRLVSRLDIYDLLLNGDTSGDVRLQPGDVIFVAPIGPQVSVDGAVNRPAIYETRGDTSVRSVIRMAGGFKADAYAEGARVERIDSARGRVVEGVDAASDAAAQFAVRDGDVLIVPKILPEFEDIVTLMGHAYRNGPYQWHNGMRLLDLISSRKDLKAGSDANYLLIRRESGDSREVSIVSANLSAALANPGSEDNVRLHPRDTVYVFDQAYGRQQVINPILDELRLQARSGRPFPQVSVTGQVRAPGEYPLETGMRVSDLVRAGGDLSEQAYTLRAEVARYDLNSDRGREGTIIDIDLAAILRGDTAADLVLREHDNLRISRVPEWDALSTIQLQGEVKFPGTYRFRRGETLSDILQRAGGLTEQAFPQGSVFLRQSLRQREQERIDMLARRLESDLTSVALADEETDAQETLATGERMLAQLRETEAVGRLVIDLELITSHGGSADVIGDVELRDGDQLLVPVMSQEVTVIGETQQNVSHLYQPGLSRQDYIDMSGGLTRRADKKLIYVVRASGAVISGGNSRWFGRGDSVEILPGDTIVVPMDTHRVRPLTLWANVTQILYQAAIAVAAVRSFDD